MSPDAVAAYLTVMRDAGLMRCHLKIEGLELDVTLGPDMGALDEMPEVAVPMPGGWKQELSDPEDTDPLGLGQLDAAIEVLE